MYTSGLISPLDLNAQSNPLNAPGLAGLGSGLTEMMRTADITGSGHMQSPQQSHAHSQIQGLPQPHVVHAPSPVHGHLAHGAGSGSGPASGPGSSEGHGSRSHVEADDEGGLNISFGSRKGRGRKGSVLRSGAPSRTESPMPPLPKVEVNPGALAERSA